VNARTITATMKGPLIRFSEPVADMDEAYRVAGHLLSEDESLVPQGPDSCAVGRGTSGHVAAMVVGGMTYREAAQSAGISPERARQLTAPYLNTAAKRWRREAMERRRHEQALQKAVDYAQQHPGASIARIVNSVRSGLSAQDVIGAIGTQESFSRPMRASSRAAAKFGEEQCLDALRRAAAVDGGSSPQPLSAVRYSTLRRAEDPSPQTVMLRFGSWSAACVRAGVPDGNNGVHRRTQRRLWTDDQLYQFVRAFFSEAGPAGTPANYEEWRKTARLALDGAKANEPTRAPSLVTLRSRLGAWSRIRSIAMGGD
jgi:hypothetical protein